jgi:uncharacterized protein YcfJ
MFKLAIALVLLGTTAATAGNVNATVSHKYKTVWREVPTTSKQCYNKEVPIYGTVRRQGDAAAGALFGMILGGVTGKVISGNDKGAAGGAVIGGLIGADQGSKSRNETVITGYRNERVCEDMTTWSNKKERVYSHSIIRWTENGVTNVLEFQR